MQPRAIFLALVSLVGVGLLGGLLGCGVKPAPEPGVRQPAAMDPLPPEPGEGGVTSPPQTLDTALPEPNVVDETGDAVILESPDGTRLYGQLHLPGGEAKLALLLLHDMARDHTAWDFPTRDGTFLDALVERDFAVLAVDLRGHGQSTGADGQRVTDPGRNLTEEDWRSAREDVAQAAAYLAARTEAPLVIVGASIGANLGVLFAEEYDPVLTGLALISPGLQYRGIGISDSMENIGEVRLWAVASHDDQYSAETVQALEGMHASLVSKLYDGNGHGTALLREEPAAVADLLSWLENLYLDTAPAGALARTDVSPVPDRDSDRADDAVETDNGGLRDPRGMERRPATTGRAGGAGAGGG